PNSSRFKAHWTWPPWSALSGAAPGLEIIDLRHRSAVSHEREVEATIERLGRASDPGDGAIQAALMLLGDEDYRLIVVTHRALIDGPSRGILYDDLATFYRGHAHGEAARPAPIIVGYRSFAAWQTSLSERPTGKAQLAFWERTI